MGSARALIYRRSGRPTHVLALACCVVAAGCGHSGSRSHKTLSEAAASGSIADVAERTVPGVVNVASTKTIRASQSPLFKDPFFRFFFEHPLFRRRAPRERKQRSLGSGVIVSRDGIVLTNNHVIDQADEITVHLTGGQQHAAEVVGTDPQSDLAVLRLKGKVGSLSPIPFGDSDALRLGEVVLAIGNPFGVGQTVTMGIVSAKGRANVGIVDYEDFIQTDAAINPGNSGGALVNLRGELVGINTAILSRKGGYQGIGFAIPSNMARGIQKSIVAHGEVVRGWLGLAVQDLTPDLARALGASGRQGVLISDVTPDSPAERSGLRAGDLILAADDKPITSAARFRSLVASHAVGAKVTLTFLREGSEHQADARLAELPAGAGGASQIAASDGALGGLTVVDLSEHLRQRLDIPPRLKHGVLVKALVKGTPAGRSGMRVGDVIVEINRQPVSSASRFVQAYRRAREQVLLLVYRAGSTHYLLLRK